MILRKYSSSLLSKRKKAFHQIYLLCSFNDAFCFRGAEKSKRDFKKLQTSPGPRGCPEAGPTWLEIVEELAESWQHFLLWQTMANPRVRMRTNSRKAEITTTCFFQVKIEIGCNLKL